MSRCVCVCVCVCGKAKRGAGDCVCMLCMCVCVCVSILIAQSVLLSALFKEQTDRLIIGAHKVRNRAAVGDDCATFRAVGVEVRPQCCSAHTVKQCGAAAAEAEV